MSAARSKATRKSANVAAGAIPVERVQTGIRVERRLLKVLKGIAEYHDMTLGDLLEGVCLHAIEGKAPFGKETVALAAELKRLYGLDLDATASHRMRETAPARAGRPRRTPR
jgi:predicted DNA-binding ribbon-helix-helix protein